jgi:glycosyltransferase involved in cell wall biosynthesis
MMDHVTLTGLLDDVRSRVAGSSCSVVPIFTGGGTRLKILESMALHTPVVTTTKGAEGLEVKHGVHLLIADEPHTFATEVVRLLRDESYSQYLADNAYNLMVERYDWGKVKTQFLDIVSRVVKQ